MERLDLGGLWQLTEGGRNPRVTGAIPAEVPGVVHEALIDADQIADPLLGLAERDALWVGRRPWIYRRRVSLPESMAGHEVLEWVCEGLDTLCELRWNNRRVLKADNQFRSWRAPVSAAPGEPAELELRFASVFPYLATKNGERACPGWGVGVDKDDTGAWVRKSPFNFGWDWAPKLVTAGPWRPLRLEAWSVARLSHARIQQRHKQDGSVELEVRVDLQRAPSGVGRALDLELTLALDGHRMHSLRGSVQADFAVFRFGVADPQLWQPRGQGLAVLYDLDIELSDAGQPLDRLDRRIGLRCIELIREHGTSSKQESFRFAVNGRELFLRGANWIPATAFPVERGDPLRDRSKIEARVRQAADAHVNCLRVWGGGLYEHEDFYSLCDELGILVWQDFCFACTTYPAFDADFMDNVRAEAEQQVRRLHHHASLLLWCGNNEVENGLSGPRWTATRMGWKDYAKLFDRLLAEVVAAEGPNTAYWPGSPHSPLGDRMDFNNPECGDAHLWTVWHGGERFDAYTQSEHRFLSEFGFQSFPDPRSFGEVADGHALGRNSAVIAAHQKAPIAPERLADGLGHYFGQIDDWDDEQLATQWLQAWGLRLGLDHWRRNFPHCGGVLFWQWNDIWVAPTWSAIDGAGRPKALYHALGDAFAPRTLTAHASGRSVELTLIDDLPEDPALHWRWTAWSTQGQALDSGEGQTRGRRPGHARRLARIPLAGLLESAGLAAHQGLVFAELRAEPEQPPLARACAWLGPPGSLQLAEPGLQLRRVDRDRWLISAERPALFVTPRLPGWTLPSGLHLEPGVDVELVGTTDAGAGALAHPAAPELRHLARATST